MKEQKRMLRNIIGLLVVIMLYLFCLWWIFFACPDIKAAPWLWKDYKSSHLGAH